MFILFSFLLLKLISSLIFKTPSGYLCCGIFGGSGKIDLNFIKILGIYNDSRGGDGTGYFYNDKINKGVFTRSRFIDLIKAEPIKKGQGKLFIGHTRKQSSGVVSLENTHPFEIDNSFVLSHNGTIYNIKELCEKFDVKYEANRVDSYMLAKIIYQTKSFDVLNHYVGYAALAMCDKSNPDELYLFHGASTERTYGQLEEVLEEERPLFFMQEKGKSCALYFSSIKESLEAAANGEDTKIYSLKHNVVYKIHNGKFSAWNFPVKRENTNYNIYDHKFPVYNRTAQFSNNNVPYKNSNAGLTRNYSAGKKNEDEKGESSIQINNLPINSLYPKNDNELFWWKGRHYKRNKGFPTPVLAEGLLYCDKHESVWAVPIQSEFEEETIKRNINNKEYVLQKYYFYNGVMMKDKDAYQTLLKENKDVSSREKMNKNNAKFFSLYSRYPVTLLAVENTEIVGNERKKWYFNGVLATCKLKPQFSHLEITLEDGYLRKLKNIIGETENNNNLVIKDPDNSSDIKISSFGEYEQLDGKVKRGIDLYIRNICNDFEKFVDLDEKDKIKSLVSNLDSFIDRTIKSGRTISECMVGKIKLHEYIHLAAQEGEKVLIPYESKAVELVSQTPEWVEEDYSISDPDIKDEDETEDESEYFDETTDNLVSVLISEDPLFEQALEIQANDSDFAQDIVSVLFESSEYMLAKLKEVCEKHNKKDLLKDIKNKKSSI